MLDLTRRQGQRVYVKRKDSQILVSNENEQVLIIEVKEVNKDTGFVTLSFDAPTDVEIWREELLLKRLLKNGFQHE